VKRTEIQALIRTYAEQRKLNCRATGELLEKILEIVLPDFKGGSTENKNLENSGGKEK